MTIPPSPSPTPSPNKTHKKQQQHLSNKVNSCEQAAKWGKEQGEKSLSGVQSEGAPDHAPVEDLPLPPLPHLGAYSQAKVMTRMIPCKSH